MAVNGDRLGTDMRNRILLVPQPSDLRDTDDLSAYQLSIFKAQGNSITEEFITYWEGGGSGTNDHSALINRDVAGNHAKLIPLSDSTTAIQITKADGTTSVFNANTSSGLLSVGAVNYESLVLNNNDIPNKKYVDDKQFAHNGLSGLTTSDAGHTQFPLLNGRSGGQTIYGGTATGQILSLKGNSVNNIGIEIDGNGDLYAPAIFGGRSVANSLSLKSTSNPITKGKIYFGSNTAYDEENIRLGIGTQSPSSTLDVRGITRLTSTVRLGNTVTESTAALNIYRGASTDGKFHILMQQSNNAGYGTFFRQRDAGQWEIGRGTHLEGVERTHLTGNLDGSLTATGVLQTGGYKASDGATGLTESFTIIAGSVTHYFGFTNGLLTWYDTN